MAPPQITIATLATGPALEDLRILLHTLGLFNANPPTVYLFCDSAIEKQMLSMDYLGKLHIKNVLNEYSAFDRRTMEAMPGKHFKTLWMDFMTEKINLLRWALSYSKEGVLLCDADICFMGPLPSIPSVAKVGLSPHMIIERDEKRFGKYNGGYAFFSDVEYADVWWNACATARYYEQSALEDVAAYVREKDPTALYEFPKTHNYGWWRMFQSSHSPTHQMELFGINRAVGAGITVENLPLGSVHTHFTQRTGITDQFNLFLGRQLSKIEKAHKPAHKLLWYIGSARSINSAK
jgi:hypothetical protein